MIEPLVSICIPVHNAENYIEEMIQSVLTQDYKNIELIIVDDGSTDLSLEIAQKHTCNRIKVYSQTKNGASAARNKCLTMAKGEYIQFLDADDLLSPDKISEQVKLLIKNPGMVAVCSTVHFEDKNNHLQYRPSPYEESFLIDTDPVNFLINLYGGFGDNGSMVQPNAWLTPKNIIEKAGHWNEELSLDDDGEYFSRVLLNSEGIIKSKGYNYYRKQGQTENNLSSLKEEQHLESQYKSLKLKISNLELFEPHLINIKKIHARWLHDLLFKAYPAHHDLVKQLTSDISSLQIDYHHKYTFGSFFGEILYKILGWKMAKRMQSFKRSWKL